MSIHLPSDWVLIAKDAFNGMTLWKRAIKDWVNPLWPLKSGPASIPRRLVAFKDSVYVTLGISAPVSCLDAMTGEQRFVLADSAHAQEMILHDGILICLINPISPPLDTYHPDNVKSPDEQKVVDKKWAWKPETVSLRAYDVRDRKKLWQINTPVATLGLAASNDNVFFYDGKFLHAVSHKTGDEVWVSEEVSRRASLAPYFGVNLIATRDVVLFSGGDRLMTAVSAETGKELWQAKHNPSGYRSSEDLFVIDGQVLSGDIANFRTSGKVEALDLQSGKLCRTLPADTGMRHWPHHRCYRSKATERYILSSRTGIEFCDTNTGAWFNNHWTRGACLVGVMPCNGLVYVPSHHCMCFSESQLEGFNALTPRPASISKEPVQRLEPGLVYERLKNRELTPSAADSWPMHRHDPQRSGATPAPIGDIDEIAWTTPVGNRLTSPVIAGDTLVVADIDSGAVYALDAGTGTKLWRFVAGGRVDSAPTLLQDRAIFGCADGWIYCLDLSDGSMAWRFLAAPSKRQHVAYDQVESVWPVHGSILIKDNMIHAVAGRSRFTDGGMRLLQIDPLSGAKISERVLDERREGDGRPIQENFNENFLRWEQWNQTRKGRRVPLMTLNEAGKPSLLTVDNNDVFMRGYQVRFGDEEHKSLRRSRLQVPWGLTSAYWSHRASWRYANSPISRILVFNNAGNVFGLSFTVRYQTLLNSFDHCLYGKSLAPGNSSDLWPNQKLPILVRAMVLAGDKLVIAGPPDYGMFDEPKAYRRHSEAVFRRDMKQQADAWEGTKGGILWVINTKDGARLTELQLPSPPIFDGMASTSSGIHISTMDGHVMFLKSN